jgi:hypothetical protein
MLAVRLGGVSPGLNELIDQAAGRFSRRLFFVNGTDPAVKLPIPLTLTLSQRERG